MVNHNYQLVIPIKFRKHLSVLPVFVFTYLQTYRSRNGFFLYFIKMDNLEIGSGGAGGGSNATIEAAKQKPQSALEQALLVRSMTLLHSTYNHKSFRKLEFKFSTFIKA